MKFKIGDKVVTFFGNGTVLDFLQKEDINLYKVELSEGNHKGKMPWFAEHEGNIIYEEVIDKLEKAGPQK